jgi:hypothetical protein
LNINENFFAPEVRFRSSFLNSISGDSVSCMNPYISNHPINTPFDFHPYH